MAYIELTSDRVNNLLYYEETALNSGEFNSRQFNVATVKFEYDPDYNYIRNVNIVDIGDTCLKTDQDFRTEVFRSAVRYVQNNIETRSLRVIQWAGQYDPVYSAVCDPLDPPITGSKYRRGQNFHFSSYSETRGLNVAIWWGREYNVVVLFYSVEYPSVPTTFNYTVYTKANEPEEYAYLLDLFYNQQVVAGNYSLSLISPSSRFFRAGQSSTIDIKLLDEFGVDTTAVVEIEPTTLSDGWSWDSSSNTLTYSGGSMWQVLRASTTYQDESYADTFAFFPPSGTSPYLPGGNSGFGGGGGNFGQDDRNDNVSGDIPGGSTFGYIGGSIYTQYALSGAQAMHFGEWLWTDDLGLSLWKTVMEKLFNETADALVSLMCFPFNISTLPGVSLGEGKIIAGNLNTGIPARVLGSPYASINWGLVTLNEYWGNFLDYAPHTKLELYLPWSTGFVPLDPHQCVPGSVSVTTNIDLQKGTCTHNVFAGNTVLGVYEGQCGYEVPLLASNFSAKLAGATVAAVSTVVTAGAAAAVGGASAIASGRAMQQVASHNSMIKSMMPGTARNMAGLSGPMTDPGMLASKNFLESQLQMASAPSPIDYSPISHGVGSKIASASSSATAKQPVNISRNGSFSGSSAGMSVPYPFIVISRPEQNVPAGYGHHFGYPSNITSILGQLKGYTEVGAIHLNGLKALPDEIAELDDILKGGFII